MAISINWATKVIFVPKADLTLIQLLPAEIRELNLNQFHLWLKDLEDSEAGMIFPDTHKHNTEVLLGGVTYARVVEIINGYTVTFENGTYAVNLVGANSNVGDVANVNSVSIRSANSAGLITVVSGSGVTEQDKLDIADRVWDENIEEHEVADSTGEALSSVAQIELGRWKIINNQMIFYAEDGVTPLRVFDLFDSSGNPTMTNVAERVPA